MANTKSAQKAARQTIRRTAVNKSRRSEMRTYRPQGRGSDRLQGPEGRGEALSEAEPSSRAPRKRASFTRTPRRGKFRA